MNHIDPDTQTGLAFLACCATFAALYLLFAAGPISDTRGGDDDDEDDTDEGDVLV